MRNLSAVLLEASTADVLEGLARLVLVLVSALLLAILVVEIDADLILTHEELGNTVDVLLSLLLLARLVVGRSSGVLLELLQLSHSNSRIIQPIIIS